MSSLSDTDSSLIKWEWHPSGQFHNTGMQIKWKKKTKHKSTAYMQNTLENSHDITMLALIILKG